MLIAFSEMMPPVHNISQAKGTEEFIIVEMGGQFEIKGLFEKVFCDEVVGGWFPIWAEVFMLSVHEV